MNDLPRGWEVATIADVTTAFVSIDPKKAPDQTFRYVDIGSIDNKSQTITAPKAFVGKDAPSRARRVIQTDDTLFSTVRTYLKNIALVPRGLNGELTSTGIAVLRPGCAVDANYLFRWVSSDPFVDELSAAQDGTMYPAVSDTDVASATIPLPPLSEQRRIVAKIGSLTGKSTRARDHLDHIPRLVEKYKQAILAAAFRGDLTSEWRNANPSREAADRLVERIDPPVQSRGGREATTNIIPGIAGLSVNDPGTKTPEGWSWISLRRIARQETGHTPSRSKSAYWNGGVPWIGIRDAGSHHGQVIHDTIQTVSDEGLANSSARILPTGTVCLSRTASVGYVTVMGRPMATSQDFATWTCTEALLPTFLMYALIAEGDRIREFGEGSTHTTIYFPEIRALHICLAPLEEQKEIVRRIESAFSWIERLAADATSARKLIDHLNQAVLNRAFRGELVPQDPADEPVSALLGRIRAERATSPKSKRGCKGAV